MLTELIIDNYTIKSTGADGRYKYISAEIKLKGKTKKLTILFADKSDEKELKNNEMPIMAKSNCLVSPSSENPCNYS